MKPHKIKYKNKKQIKRLIESLEIRKAHLTSMAYTKHVSYKLHNGHWLRDIFTVLAVLREDKDAEDLLNNMPKE